MSDFQDKVVVITGADGATAVPFSVMMLPGGKTLKVS